MRRLHLILGILSIFIALQLIGLLLLSLLLYQATPNSVLANQTFIGKIPGVLSMTRLIDRSTNFLYRAPRPEEPLPQYSLKIDSDDYQKVVDALPKELPSDYYTNLFLTEEAKEWVDAEFSDGNQIYDVEVRVRGDLFNHWAYNKKSWRVKFKKSQLFNGMREMNLILPEDRFWFAEPLNVYRANHFGLLHPPMQFVTVSVNGSGPLLYTEVEHWTKEMLEKQGRPGDVNIYNTGGGKSKFQQWDPAFDHIEYWDKYIEDPSAPDNFDEVEQLLALSEDGAHQDPNFVAQLSAIIDVDRLTSWYAVSLLSGSRHVSDFNFRVFFDISRGVFEPLPWDISLYNPRTLHTPPGNTFLNEVFKHPQLRLEAYQKVWEYITDDDTLEADNEELERLILQSERAAYRDSFKRESNRQVRHRIHHLKGVAKKNFEFLEEELKTSEVLVTQRVPSTYEQQQGDILKLDLTARGASPAFLSEIHLPEALFAAFQKGAVQLWRGDEQIFLTLRDFLDSDGMRVVQVEDVDSSLLWTGDPVFDDKGHVKTAPHTTHNFILRVTDGTRLEDTDYPFKLDVRNAVTERKANVIGETLVDERTFENIEQVYQTRADFLRTYPFFTAGQGNEVVLSGGHYISKTVIIPSTVRVNVRPGTHVRLAPDVTILSYAPVSMIGYKTAPIIFEGATSKPWGVFGVLNAKEPSALQWVEFSDGGETRINGAYFTGMLAFHNSPVTITDSVFSNAHGDDGLNIKYVVADINRVRFEENGFDGLDVDFAPGGVVESCYFINNGNDGLDISGSPITIRNIEADGNGDKCISVGEGSSPHIHDSTLANCIYGIAAKDASVVKAERVLFENNDIAVGAYVKKPFFGPPSADVFESTFTNNAQNSLTLSGATVTIHSE